MHRLAINPLPWVLHGITFDLSVATLTPALEQLGPIGFSAIQADIPAGMTPARYGAFLNEHGFVPAPGYFGAAFEDAGTQPTILEALRTHAAQQAELGLSVSFIAQNVMPERLQRPAIGTSPSSDRVARIAEGLAAAAAVAAREGVTIALHPHVATGVEVEAEIRYVLDATDGTGLQFGADVGHLAWAGMDPAQLISDYRSRVVAIHLKDVDAAAAKRARAADADYLAAVNDEHVWIEPGRGIVNFGAIFDALGDDFEGWSVVEVDVPALPTPEDSARASFQYLTAQPFFNKE